jgi:thiol-disulfide isomerase/thioredoxin
MTDRPIEPISVDTNDAYDDYLSSVDHGTVTLHQFTATWCKKCTTIKEEIVTKFSEDDSIRWVLSDITETDELAQRFEVSKLPRLDVYRGARLSGSLEAFDVTIESIISAVEEAKAPRPTFTIDEDF